MSIYTESNIKINPDKIEIRSLLLPLFSSLTIESKDVQSVKVVKLTTAQRLNMMGTQNLRTWWCFDKKRPFRRKGIIILLKEPIGPFKRIAFTVEDIDQAEKVLEENNYL